MTGDELLRECLAASGKVKASEERGANALDSLISEHLDGTVRAVIGRRLGGSIPWQDREDTISDTIAELIERLADLKAGRGTPISNIAAYAAVAAHHSCDRYLRDRYPRRHRLRNRVRYFIDNSTGFVVWQTANGDTFCAVRAAQHKPAPALAENWFAQVAIPPGSSESETVSAMLHAVNAPVSFDALAEAVGHLTGLGSEAPADWTVAEASAADATPDYDARIDRRRLLERLWFEVRSLPLTQRRALLLNLRDERGASPLVVLPAAGVATLREIASVLEWSATDVARLWGRLPLSDLEVAEMLQLRRQQIINLRKSARERLGRRMSSNISPVSPSN